MIEFERCNNPRKLIVEQRFLSITCFFAHREPLRNTKFVFHEAFVIESFLGHFWIVYDQGYDCVSGLHSCQEFFQLPECLDEAV